MIVKYCIKQMVVMYICVCASFDYECPHISHWNLRAGELCNTMTQYYCLFDVNSGQHNELCRPTPDFETSGYRIVLLGGLNGKLCTSDRYQPFLFWTNGSSDCTFQKSLCSEEGQMIQTGSLSGKDTTCCCDNSRGYSFVLQPKHTTYCVPSEEDCLCYTKLCVDGKIPNTGYQCETGSLSHNGSTTSDSTISSKNKSTEIGFLTVNPKPVRMRFTSKIIVFTSIMTLTTVLIIIILLLSFCTVKNVKKTDRRTGKTELHKIDKEQVVKEDNLHLQYRKRETGEDSFITTTAFRCIYTTVRENKVTIISGPPSCGKTSMCNQAALKLEETDNYVLIDVVNPLQLIKSLNDNVKPLIVIDDIVGQYSLNKTKLQAWGAQSHYIHRSLELNVNAKLIVICRSYIYKNETFSFLKIPHVHCDMLADKILLTKNERRQICNLYVSEKETHLLLDTVLMLYNFFPLICVRFRNSQKKYSDYFTYPYDIIETEMNLLRLSSDPCFIALGLLVISYDSIDKQSLMVHDHNQTADGVINEILNDMLQDVDGFLVSLKGVFSSLSLLKNIYVKETSLKFTCTNKSMFKMLVGIVGRHFIPCILKHSNSDFIKAYIELAPYTTDQNPPIIEIESQYEKLYFRRIIDDISNGLYIEVFDTFQMKRKDYRLFFLENILKTETLTFCRSKRNGSTPLHITSSLGYNEFSFFFIENDKSQIKSRDSTGKTPLHIACLKGNTAVVKLLITSGAEVNQMDTNKVTPFMLACRSGNIELIRFLLTKDVNINAFNSFGFTPILESCSKHNVNVCSFLLENKAKVDCFNKNGDTPLHLACQAGEIEILNMLLKYNIETCINRPNVKGYTPFYLALYNGHNEIANKIIKHGADPNYQNENGSTPLHIACETNKLEMVKILLKQYQVEFNKKDNKGRTPLDVSKINNHKYISQLLIDREQRDENIVNIPIISTSTC